MQKQADWLRSVRAWIFDLDNTLVECLHYYDTARNAVHALLVQEGVRVSHDEFVRELGVVRKPLFQSMGFGHESFAVSLRETFRVLSERSGLTPQPGHLHAAYNLGYSVRFAPYSPYPGVLDVLKLLRRRGHRLALLTKGMAAAQQRKVRLHGLESLFDHIETVPYKTVKEVRAVLRVIDAEPAQTAVVGDSLFDDILSGQQAGCHTIWINGDPVEHPELYGDARRPVPDMALAKVSDLSRLLVPAQDSVVVASRSPANQQPSNPPSPETPVRRLDGMSERSSPPFVPEPQDLR